MQKNKTVFVTVGTTKFEKLIETVSNQKILNILNDLGYTKVIFQNGHDNRDYKNCTYKTLQLTYRKYFEDFENQIEKADLIISHAGAGTCLQVLHKCKPLIVVINEDLMDNHQMELAEQLAEGGFLFYCMCDSLDEVLKKSLITLNTYPMSNPKLFCNFIDKCMGF